MADDSSRSAYAAAGVDIDAQERALGRVKKLVKSTFTPGVLSDIGSFGGLFRPDLSGLDALRNLKAEAISAGVVMISGDDDATNVVEAMRLGALDYLVKPLDPEKVIATIGLAARAGYPIIVVPFGFVANEPGRPFGSVGNEPVRAFPEGFEALPAPFGVGFTGGACSEPRLIELAYAFEQATMKRVPPEGFR